MIKDITKNFFTLNKCGTKSHELEKTTYCFGLLDNEAFFQKEIFDDKELAKEMSSAYNDYNNQKMIEENIPLLRELNSVKGQNLVILDYDLVDALMFNHKMKQVDATIKSVEITAKEQGINNVFFPNKDDNKNIEALKELCLYCYQDHDLKERNDNSSANNLNFNDKEDITFISKSRIHDLVKGTYSFGYKEIIQNAKVTKKDASDFVLHHEIGHGVFPDRSYQNSTFFEETDYYSERHKDECYADCFAALMSLKNRKNSDFLKIQSHIRNNDYLSSALLIIENDNKKANPNTIVAYNTSPLINKVIEMYDQDKEKFHNMSFIEISKFAYEMTTKNCINFEEFEKEVKSLEKKEKTELFNNALKQREEFFKENGLSEEENLKRWNDFLSYKPKKEDLGTKLKNSIKKEFKRWLLTHPVVKYTKLKEILDKKLNNDNKSNVTRNFKKRIAKEMVEKNKSYERAMLDLYKERAKYDTSYYFNSLAAKDTYETMHDIIINNKDKFKEDIFTSQNAFGAQFNKIEISEDVKEAKGQKGLELYTNHKNEYRKILKSVIKSVRKGNITEEVKQDFKKSLYHAKQYITLSKNLSVEIDEGKLNVDKRLAHFIKKDSKNLYPKELNKMFKNKKPVMIMNFASKQR